MDLVHHITLQKARRGRRAAFDIEILQRFILADLLRRVDDRDAFGGDAAEETKSQTLADQIELEATQCEAAFDEARIAAIAAASAATLDEATAQADIAEKAAKQADLEYSELADLLSQLGALGV